MKQTFLVLATLAFAASATAAPCSFTYNARKKTMTLTGDCTVTMPSEKVVVPDGYTLKGNSHTITAMPAPDQLNSFKGPVVTNGGAVANIENLTVTAFGLPCIGHGGADRIRGILLDGAAGSISNVNVTEINQGGSCGYQEGNGIEVRNLPFDGSGTDPLAVTISDSTVSDYQKNGVTCNGNVACTIKNVTAAGFGSTLSIAQNGIQFGYGARGKASYNYVAGHWYTGANWSSTGVLVFEASNVKVHKNTVVGNQVGVAAETWHYSCANASDNQITRNSIQESEWGIIVDALSYWSIGDAHADRNLVAYNEIVDVAVAGDTGIWVGTADYGFGFNQTADSNTIQDNLISGFATDVVHDGDTNTQGNQLVAMPMTPAQQPFEP